VDDPERPVDLDQWLESTGSAEVDADEDGLAAARRLQGKLLDVLDDETVSVVPSQVTDLDQGAWERLDCRERVELRRAALRRVDPRLMPRTVRRVFGRAPGR
jgi:hypothetical protein